MDGLSTIILSNGGGGGGLDLAALSRYVSALLGRQVDLAPPVVAVLDLADMDDPSIPITPLLYDDEALTLTFGVNMVTTDLSPLTTLGASMAVRFLSGDRERSGVYTITDIGADDPGGHPPVLTRRADLDDAADVDGSTVYSFVGPDSEDDDQERLYQLQGPFPLDFDTDPMVFDTISLVLTTDRVIGVVSDYTMLPGDTVVVNATSGPITITLPPISDMPGRRVQVKKTDVSVNAVTVVPNPADSGVHIDGATTFALDVQFMGAEFSTDGDNWWVF